MKRAFTLVEILIAVSILGILAAATLPLFRNYILEAKESAAKDNLRVLRNAIEVYAAQHKDIPPGFIYKDNVFSPMSGALLIVPQLTQKTNISGEFGGTVEAGYKYGPYLRKIPKNPFNGIDVIQVNESTPKYMAGFGWICNPKGKKIYLNRDGIDKNGVRYLDY